MSRSRQIALNGVSFKGRSLASNGFILVTIIEAIKTFGRGIAARMPNYLIPTGRMRK